MRGLGVITFSLLLPIKQKWKSFTEMEQTGGCENALSKEQFKNIGLHHSTTDVNIGRSKQNIFLISAFFNSFY
jgi:hypothetical protein